VVVFYSGLVCMVQSIWINIWHRSCFSNPCLALRSDCCVFHCCDCSLFNGRFQMLLEDLALQKGLWMIYRLLAYSYNYFINVFIIIIIIIVIISLSSFYHQHFMLCAIGLYMYCRRRNTNDCVHYTLVSLEIFPI